MDSRLKHCIESPVGHRKVFSIRLIETCLYGNKVGYKSLIRILNIDAFENDPG